MKINHISDEWKDLKTHLQENEENDGERCFYAGILFCLTELNNLIENLDQVKSWETEIAAKLQIGDQ